jgi:hypothetical protein
MEDDQNDGNRNSEPATPSTDAGDGDLWARAAALARRDLQRAQAREFALKPARPRVKTK